MLDVPANSPVEAETVQVTVLVPSLTAPFQLPTISASTARPDKASDWVNTVFAVDKPGSDNVLGVTEAFKLTVPVIATDALLFKLYNAPCTWLLLSITN